MSRRQRAYLQPARWTQEHIDVFRQLTRSRLGKLNPFGGRWSDEELIMLAADPASAHLRLLPLNLPSATRACGDALARLPISTLSFSFLRRMSKLKSLIMNRMLSHVLHADLDTLATTLAECTQLTLLTTPEWMTNTHFCRILPSMPHLRELNVILPSDGGLSFASSVPHLARTLEKLDLNIRDVLHIISS